jgi:hypothetical protein
LAMCKRGLLNKLEAYMISQPVFPLLGRGKYETRNNYNLDCYFANVDSRHDQYGR